MDNAKQITLYDIASGPPVTCYAPNPWKTRYALNFKGVAYRTQWVEFPDVEQTRKGVCPKPSRYFPDGNPYYTLPVIKDDTTGETIGDSFEIAQYLDKTSPNGPTLLPPATTGLMAAFNTQVDAIFTSCVVLCVENFPLNPANATESKAIFEGRFGGSKWDDLMLSDEDRASTLEKLKEALEGLVRAYKCKGGPFLEGDTPTYADMIVGGWLAMYRICVRSAEWEQITSWHDGLCGKIHDGLKKYAEVK